MQGAGRRQSAGAPSRSTRYRPHLRPNGQASSSAATSSPGDGGRSLLCPRQDLLKASLADTREDLLAITGTYWLEETGVLTGANPALPEE